MNWPEQLQELTEREILYYHHKKVCIRRIITNEGLVEVHRLIVGNIDSLQLATVLLRCQ
jgi:hypothetical protein